MRILLDECVPARLKEVFAGHAVQTVSQIGRSGAKDQSLMNAVHHHYDVFVTVDRSLERQYDLTCYRMGFVIVRLHNNRIETFEQVYAQLLKAVEIVKPGKVIYVASAGMQV